MSMYFPVIFHTNRAFATQSATNYTSITANNADIWMTTESDATIVIPVAMQLTNMNIVGQAPPGNGASITYTVRKNGADTALTITISDKVTTGFSDAVVSFAAGDTISFAATPTAVANHPGIMDINFLGIAASQPILMANVNSANPSNSVASYAQMFGGPNNWVTTEGRYKIPMGAAGTLSNLNVRAVTAPGGVAQYVYTVRKNGVDTGLTVTMSGTNTLVTDNTHTVSVVAGDLISLAATPTGTPVTTPSLGISLAFTPTTAGDCVFGIGCGNGTGLTTPSYAMPMGIGYGWTDITAEMNIRCYMYPCIIKSFYAFVETVPTAGTTQTYTLRKNRIDTALSVTLNAGVATGSATSAIQMSQGDVLTMGFVFTVSYSASNRAFGYALNFTASSGFFIPF